MTATEVEIAKATIETAESAGGIGVFGLNGKIFLAQLINFAVVVLILWRWAFRPIVRLLDERQKKIEKSVNDAQEIEKRLQNVELERQETLRQAKEEAQKHLTEVKAIAEEKKNELIEKTKEEVEKVITAGKRQLAAERETMIQEARQELATIALSAARKIIEDEVDEEKGMALAEAVVKKMT